MSTQSIGDPQGFQDDATNDKTRVHKSVRREEDMDLSGKRNATVDQRILSTTSSELV